MPDFREGHFVMQVSSSITGTSLDEMLAVGKRISADVLALPYVQTSSSRWDGPNSARIPGVRTAANFTSSSRKMRPSTRTRRRRQLRSILEAYPGIQSEVVTFLGDRISESLSGETAQVAVKVFGDDLDALDATGDKIVADLEQGARRRRLAIQASERNADDRHGS